MCGVDLAEDRGRGLIWGGGVVGIVGLSSTFSSSFSNFSIFSKFSSFFGTSWTIRCDKSRNLCDRGGIGGCENFLTRDSETKKIKNWFRLWLKNLFFFDLDLVFDQFLRFEEKFASTVSAPLCSSLALGQRWYCRPRFDRFLVWLARKILLLLRTFESLWAQFSGSEVEHYGSGIGHASAEVDFLAVIDFDLEVEVAEVVSPQSTDAESIAVAFPGDSGV